MSNYYVKIFYIIFLKSFSKISASSADKFLYNISFKSFEIFSKTGLKFSPFLVKTIFVYRLSWLETSLCTAHLFAACKAERQPALHPAQSCHTACTLAGDRPLPAAVGGAHRLRAVIFCAISFIVIFLFI